MADFNMKERSLKPQINRRDMNTNTNTNTRRFSASNWKSFREDHERFLRPNTTISSAVSSPGYTTTDEIDPSTYSFTAALKALQTRGVCSWEHLPAERLTLHSKWSDAEKYISNPLSGEVPVECLSAKTLSARSFSSLTNRISISAPLHFQTKIPIIQHQHKLNITIQEKKRSAVTRDVGIQSAPAADFSAPATPSIEERSIKHSEGESVDSSLSIEKDKPKVEVEEREAKEKEGRNTKEGRERKKKKMMMMCSQGGGRRGCLLSLKGLWQRRNKCNCNCKPTKNNHPSSNSSSSPTFLYHINASYDV